MDYTFFVISIIIAIIAIIVLMFNNTQQNTHKSTNDIVDLSNKTFYASSKYADVTYTTSENADILIINVNYKDLSGVSAIHIHVNDNGKPGPILAWLGTTLEWNSGTVQNTPGTNLPCHSKNNKLCNLIAPPETPLISELYNVKKTYIIKKEQCDNNCSCPWINNGTLLDIHGFNFQKFINGIPTEQKPGADVIDQQKFTKITF